MVEPATPPAARPGRRERRRRETRERLLRAALELFATRGIAATTIEDITEAADTGKGTFFNYFPSKEHVLAAFGEIQLAKVDSALAEARAEGSAMPDVLRRLARELAREPGRSPALVQSMVVAILSSEVVRDGFARNLAKGRRRLAELFALGQERGEFRRDFSPAMLARLFQQTMFGTLLLWALNSKTGLAHWLEPTLNFFLSSVAASNPPRRKKEGRQ